VFCIAPYATRAIGTTVLNTNPIPGELSRFSCPSPHLLRSGPSSVFTLNALGEVTDYPTLDSLAQLGCNGHEIRQFFRLYDGRRGINIKRTHHNFTLCLHCLSCLFVRSRSLCERFWCSGTEHIRIAVNGNSYKVSNWGLTVLCFGVFLARGGGGFP
jgi:hypothetical protein